jgi:hypothetical protein
MVAVAAAARVMKADNSSNLSRFAHFYAQEHSWMPMDATLATDCAHPCEPIIAPPGADHASG